MIFFPFKSRLQWMHVGIAGVRFDVFMCANVCNHLRNVGTQISSHLKRYSSWNGGMTHFYIQF